MKKLNVLLILVFVAGFSQGMLAQDMKEDVAMIKKNLTESKAKMKSYEWIETTTSLSEGRAEIREAKTVLLFTGWKTYQG